jgi:hypothetical protein
MAMLRRAKSELAGEEHASEGVEMSLASDAGNGERPPALRGLLTAFETMIALLAAQLAAQAREGFATARVRR